MQNLYAVLEINQDASRQQIVASFRRLALTYHPDRNKSPGAKERFIEVYQAYEILVDSRKRQTYDSLLSGGFAQAEKPANSQSERYEQWAWRAEERARHYSTTNSAAFAKVLLSALLRSFVDILSGVAIAVCLIPAVFAIGATYRTPAFLLLTIAVIVSFLGILLIRDNYQRIDEKWRRSHKGFTRIMASKKLIPVAALGLLVYCILTTLMDAIPL